MVCSPCLQNVREDSSAENPTGAPPGPSTKRSRRSETRRLGESASPGTRRARWVILRRTRSRGFQGKGERRDPQTSTGRRQPAARCPQKAPWLVSPPPPRPPLEADPRPLQGLGLRSDAPADAGYHRRPLLPPVS